MMAIAVDTHRPDLVERWKGHHTESAKSSYLNAGHARFPQGLSSRGKGNQEAGWDSIPSFTASFDGI